MDEIEGLPGELLGRLIELLNGDALGDEGGWYSVSFFASFFLGGQALRNVIPDTGRPPVPGTIGEMERQRRELVSRERVASQVSACETASAFATYIGTVSGVVPLASAHYRH